jgi:hypothetical protein
MMRFNVVGYSGLVVMFGMLSACMGVATVGTDDDGNTKENLIDGDMTDLHPSDYDTTDLNVGPAVGACGDITPVVLEWSLHSLGGGDYGVSTLLEVEGTEDCFLFDGSHEYDALELFWSDDDASHLIERSWNGHDHSGFGPRDCDGTFCEIGDIFELRWIYPDYPGQSELDDLLDTYGPPDTACGYVANADLLLREYCGPFNP